MQFYFHRKLFAWLTIGFIIATILGTTSHEFGHCIVAKITGNDTELHYDRMSHTGPKYKKFNRMVNKYHDKLMQPGNSPEKTEIFKLNDELARESFFITLGGPLLTVFTAGIGLLILYLHRKKIRHKTALDFGDWLSVFMAFFWARPLFNLLIEVFIYIKRDTFSGRSDETTLAEYLNWPRLSIEITTAAVGLFLLTCVVFFIIPKQQRFTFLVSGLFGSAAGFILWMRLLGPVILP